MNCVKCEIRRAKWRAALMVGLGKGLHEVADHLTKTYGENYYVSKLDGPFHITFTVWRAGKVPPYTQYEIYSLSTGKS